uniref:Uncharacterized protein n=1 Tax=Anguilla anguilla TaxID=7936 RepID=A0A0E9VWP6_ANGAN
MFINKFLVLGNFGTGSNSELVLDT